MNNKESDELKRDLRHIIQNTPSEFQIYTILAEEIVKRIMPTIQSLLKQAELRGALKEIKGADMTGGGYYKANRIIELESELTKLKGEE